MFMTSFTSHVALFAPQLEAAFRTARDRHPILSRFGDVADLLASYRPESGLSPIEHSQISTALIEEVRAAREPRWQLVILGAHRPMLFRLARRTGGDAPEEAQHRAASAFVEALHSVNLGDGTKTLVRLMARTNRLYWRLRRREIDPEADLLDDAGWKKAGAHNDGGMGAILVSPRELARMLDGMRDPERMADVVQATAIDGQCLRQYLAAQKPANDNGLSDVEVESMQRARHRALQRLRAALEEIDGPLSGF